MLKHEFGPALIGLFDRFYIINLPERADRRDQMERQLRNIGLSLADSRITLFPAVKSEAEDGFPSTGAHGCYRSHLSILKEARDRGYRNVLVAEDDLDFVPGDRDAAELLRPLGQRPWHFFFAGYHFPERFLPDGTGLVDVGGRYSIGGAHLYGVSADAYVPLIAYLEQALAGPAPRPHVDVAISEFRATHPGCVTFVASPALGIQRRSRSDIQVLRFYDRLPFMRSLADILRTVVGRRRS